MKIIPILLIGVLVFLAGCAEEKPELKYIQIPGQGNQVYEFTTNLYDSINVPIDSAYEIKSIFDSSSSVAFVFDGTSESDNAVFQVSIINTIVKLKTFYLYEGKLLDDFPAYYYTNDTSVVWYNKTNDVIEKPELNTTTIWFNGPNSGATETSVTHYGNTIHVQGATREDIQRASDRLILAVFGVNQLPEPAS